MLTCPGVERESVPRPVFFDVDGVLLIGEL
jgi:hypothetical protein